MTRQSVRISILKRCLRATLSLHRLKCVDGSLQLLIPRSAKTASQGGFQKAIEGQTQFLAFAASRIADAPAVIIESYVTIAQSLFANGVQGAGDRLAPIRMLFAISTLGSAEAATGFVAGEDAVLPIHDARHQIALNVNIGYALISNDFARLGRQTILNRRQQTLQLCGFVERKRRPTLTVYAALAVAGRKIATEIFRDDFSRQ